MVALLFLALAPAHPARAETIIYDGSDPSLLRPDPIFGMPNCLFPSSGPSGNTVNVTGGTIDGMVYGGAASDFGVAAQGNTVNISGGILGDFVYGGSSSTGDATRNTVTLSGGILGNNGNARLYGGSSNTGDAMHNTVILSGGTVNGNVYGGSSNTGDATHNTVILSGGTVNGNVYGGSSSSGAATHNTVTLSGRPEISGGIYGGSQTVFTGNTLNAMGFQGRVREVNNFENYNFVLPAGLAPGEAQITILGPTSTNLGGSNVAVTGIQGGGRVQQAGEQLVLISNTAGAPASGTGPVRVQKGVSLLYDLNVQADNNQLVAHVQGREVNPRAKALAEGRVAGMAFVNQGADLVAGAGMAAAAAAGREGFTAFTAGQAGSNRYDTGSHVDVDGVSFLAGLGRTFALDAGDLTVAAFFEAGDGNYHSSNSFSNAASVAGNGDLAYYGGGIMARMEFPVGVRYLASCGSATDDSTPLDKVYVEASGRMGRQETDFKSGQLRDISGRDAEYDSASAYYGAHAGAGYVWSMNDELSLDIGARYFWTRVESDRVTVVDDPIHFKAADSHRLRGSARLSYALSPHFVPYVGGGYEHEFDGKAKATAYGLGLDAPDLKGGTGIGEMGFSFRPVPGGHFSLDAGIQGYTGTREGVTGTLAAKWEF